MGKEILKAEVVAEFSRFQFGYPEQRALKRLAEVSDNSEKVLLVNLAAERAWAGLRARDRESVEMATTDNATRSDGRLIFEGVMDGVELKAICDNTIAEWNPKEKLMKTGNAIAVAVYSLVATAHLALTASFLANQGAESARRLIIGSAIELLILGLNYLINRRIRKIVEDVSKEMHSLVEKLDGVMREVSARVLERI